VLISRSLGPLVTKSWVDVSHDTTFAHEDHLPVVLQCQGWFQSPAKTPPIRWDEEAMLNPEKNRAFQAALNTLPIPAWHITIDDHTALYEQQVLALGRQFFSKKPE